jgi:hypothetical protein
MKTKMAILLAALSFAIVADAHQVVPTTSTSPSQDDYQWDTPTAPISYDATTVNNNASLKTLLSNWKLENVTEEKPRRIEPETPAWSTRVGWSPGQSAFPEPTTHESRLVLFKTFR